ncbi:MAG TPA: hypothetical protein VHV78_14805 [Gemmatimonadaceae bacterium]|nr:hypothetical protein [Gemmatimonadaceae bacterium]
MTSTGTVSLAAGGAITVQSFDASTGTFNFNGGTLTVSGGAYTQPSGPLTMDGANAPTFVLAGGATTSGVTSAVVGNTASGALSILSGSTLSYSGDSSIASASGSIGSVTVSGTNSLWSMSGNLYLGGSSSGAGGTGSLTIASGGTVFVGGTFEAFGNSQLNVASGATFSTSGIVAPGQITNNGDLYTNVTIASGGTLGGSGTIHGSLTMQDGSTLSPGNSPGLTTVSGDVSWSGTSTPMHYAVQIADANGPAGVGYDSLAIHAVVGMFVGQLNIAANSTIDIDLDSYPANSPVQNFVNSNAFNFTIVSADGGINGFNSASFVINSSAFELANSLGGGAFSILESPDDTQLILHFDPSAVPEPGSLLLVLIASGPFAWRLHRRKAAVTQPRQSDVV